MHDHVVAGNPVDGRSHLVLVASLQRVDHPEHFGSITTGRGWIGQNQADGLLGIDDEHRADGESLARDGQRRLNTNWCIQTYDALGVNIGRVLVVKPGWNCQLGKAREGQHGRAHVVEVGYLAVFVTDDRELQIAPRNLVDVLDPSRVAVDGVCRDTN